MSARIIEKRIHRAGLLICPGLALQLLSLIWVHPFSFMAFLTVGCPLVLGGVLLYLYSLVPSGGRGRENARRHCI